VRSPSSATALRRRAFNGLAEGGMLKMPLTEQPWGASMGWMTDKFGIEWMVNIDKA
jgi:PhnB protein